MDKWTLISILVVVGLVAGNVYQFQNPKVIETPAGTEQIDSTSWVQQSTVLTQGMIIDSLEQQNEAMAKRIEEQKDQIASHTAITGRLKTQVDSLEEAVWNSVSFNAKQIESQGIDTTFKRSKTFGDGLFRVDGYVDLRYNKTGLQVRQDFDLNQIRDIRLDVVNTISDNNSRSLVYVTSPDFESLEYQTYTELEQKNKLPWFWIGLGVGVTGAAIAF